MANVKATDLIDFTRASKGHAMAKVSYGEEQAPQVASGYQSNNATLTNITNGVNVTVSTAFGEARIRESAVVGKVYKVVFTVTVNAGSFKFLWDDVSVNDTLSSGTYSYIGVATDTEHTINFRANNNASTDFDLTNVSVKEVLFDQPDGTLQLFEHPDNIPRIEYDADGNLLGLLVEEARTNLVTYSEDFDNAAWGKLDLITGTLPVVTSEYTDGPYPQTRADRLQASRTGSGYSLIQMGSFGTNTGDYTNSIWIKSNTESNQEVYFRVKAGANKTVTATSEWQRVSITDTLSSEATYFTIGTWSNAPSSELNIDVLIWGAQTESGSFPTSYIKTSGSTVSRAADVASIDVDQFGYNQSEGTVVVHAQAFGRDAGAYPRVVELNDGTASNRIMFFPLDSLQLQVQVSGSTQAALDGGAIVYNQFSKYAGGIKAGDFNLSLDGSPVVSDTSGSMPAVTELRVGADHTGSSNFLNGHIKSITYTPKRLSNAKLQELTS